MIIVDFPDIQEWTPYSPWRFATGKLDGWRIEIIVDSRGNARALTRNSDLINEILPERHGLPRDTHLFVEALNPGMRAVKPKPGCHFYFIACPRLAGFDTRANTYHKMLSLMPHWVMSPTYFTPQELMAKFKVESERDITATDLMKLADEMNLEGFVMKYAHYNGWYKVKGLRTADLRIFGTKDGKGKFAGMIGSFIVSLEDGTVVGNAGGMNDEIRKMNPDDLIGRIVEVEYQLVGTRGGMRHPRFIRFRDDLSRAQAKLR